MSAPNLAEPQPQRRSRAISLTAEERDIYLATQRVCRMATVGSDGSPHVAPLFYVWVDGSLWALHIVRSQRATDIAVNTAVSVVVDSGEEFSQARGVEIWGAVETVGEVPHMGSEGHQALERVERVYAEKYTHGQSLVHDGKHSWIRVRPRRIISWDLSRLPPPPR